MALAQGEGLCLDEGLEESEHKWEIGWARLQWISSDFPSEVIVFVKLVENKGEPPVHITHFERLGI